jgi:two-component system sensor histidine kinase EvgS
MSHEIRTPMNAVIGMLELALKRADQGQLDRPAIEVAYSSAKDLLELIGDILDIARIESGRLTLSPERANLRQLVESVVRVFDGLARQKSLALQLDLDSRINIDVLIDPLRFKQILSNLISNAIKFTQQGQVRISLQAEDSVSEQQIRLHVIIQDSGIGITREDQARLFAPFAQADNSGQLARTGAGLGLVICRSLCEMMGGTLTLDSEPGQGTRVHMVFDLTPLDPLASLPAVKDSHEQSVATLDILVVDDHPANRLLLCQQLVFLGHRCEVAEQGGQGLEHWLARHFDLVIVDCNMPVMNGYDLTRAIRTHEHEQDQQPCTVLGFTANAQPEEIQRCREAGMDDCLFKPISLTALNERLSRIRTGKRYRGLQTENPPFDMGSILALTGDRPAMIEHLINQLISSCRDDAHELSEVSARGQRQEMRDIAHKIKGAARIISAGQVIALCDRLEHACDDDSPPPVLKDHAQSLGDALMKLEQALLLHRKG